MQLKGRHVQQLRRQIDHDVRRYAPHWTIGGHGSVTIVLLDLDQTARRIEVAAYASQYANDDRRDWVLMRCGGHRREDS